MLRRIDLGIVSRGFVIAYLEKVLLKIARIRFAISSPFDLPERDPLRNVARENLTKSFIHQRLANFSVLFGASSLSLTLSSCKLSKSRFVLTGWLVFPDGKKVVGELTVARVI